jgi:MFS family permease
MMVGHFQVTDIGRLRRARIAVSVIFFVHGALFGNWVSRIPAIKTHLHAGTGPLGLALLGLAVGALAARQVAGQLVARYGSKSITRIGMISCCVTLILPALAMNVTVLGIALLVFGAALGGADLAMNAHAVAVQEQIGRPVMSSFHGVYSLGGLTGALLGGRAAAASTSPLLHFSVVMALFGCVVIAASRSLLPSALDVAPKKTTSGGWAKVPRDSRLTLFLLGVVGLGGMAGEGAVGDWGAIYLHSNLGASAGFAASGFAAYSLAMATGRFVGDRFVGRWGGLRVVTWSLTLAGGGFGLALLIGNPFVAVCGFAILGIGLSVVIPVVFSIAGRMGGESAGPAITIVSSISGLGAVAAPPVIGFLAALVGLPGALGVVSALAFIAACLVRVVRVQQNSISS